MISCQKCVVTSALHLLGGNAVHQSRVLSSAVGVKNTLRINRFRDCKSEIRLASNTATAEQPPAKVGANKSGFHKIRGQIFDVSDQVWTFAR